MKVINNNNLPTAPITELNILQGSLKFLSENNYKKLKKSIEKYGFYIPVYVWIDEDGKKWLLDGTQRYNVLTTEGWFEPIPYLIIKAPNMATAAERLLTVASQYGTTTQEGLDEFIAKFELPEIETLEMVNFDSVFDFSVEMNNNENKFETPQINNSSKSDKQSEIQCPECGYHSEISGFAQYNDLN